MLLPRPPRGAQVAKIDEAAGKRSIYVLENGAPKEVRVTTGASDGAWTEIVDPPFDAGTPVITDSRSAD